MAVALWLVGQVGDMRCLVMLLAVLVVADAGISAGWVTDTWRLHNPAWSKNRPRRVLYHLGRFR